MKFQKNDRYTTIAIYAFLVVAAAILFFALVWNFSHLWDGLSRALGLLSPFTYGFAIAFMLNPAVTWLERKPLAKLRSRRLRRGLSVSIVYIAVLSLLVIFFWIVIPQIRDSLIGITSPMSGYVTRFDRWLRGVIDAFPTWDLPDEVTNTIVKMVENFLQWLRDIPPMLMRYTATVTTGLIRLTSGVFNLIVGVVISIYMLMGKEQFTAQVKKLLYAFVPEKTAGGLVDLARDSNKMFNSFLVGTFLDSAIVWIICLTFTILFRMPSALLVSTIIGITNIVPYFGPIFGAIPATLIILIESPVKALWFLVFIIALQQIDGNIIAPHILGDKTGIPALWAMFAVLLFGGLWGFVGMVIGIPLFAMIYSLIRALANRLLTRKNRPTDSSRYASETHPLLDTKATEDMVE